MNSSFPRTSMNINLVTRIAGIALVVFSLSAQGQEPDIKELKI